MKVFFVVVLLSCSSVAFAQTTRIMSANDKNRSGVSVKDALKSIKDTKVYDMDGNVVDSVTVEKLMRTYEYSSSWAIPKGQTELKKVIRKVDPVQEAEMENYIKLNLRPKSSKLWEGVTLDLSPLSKRTDLDKLQGKGIVLIFWSSMPPREMYEGVNNVIADHIGNNKFEVFAITHQPYDIAKEGLKKNPILNAHQVFDAQGIVDYYGTDNKPVIIVTNAQHQIMYSMTNFTPITPRIMNKLFKAL